MKIAVVATIGLSVLSCSESFTAAPRGPKVETSLNAGNIGYSTKKSLKPGSYGAVTDPAAYSASYHNRDQSGVTSYGYRKEEHIPGTTGGPGGSTLVSDYIMKDSVYGPNYHYVQNYRSKRFSSSASQEKSEQPATSYNDKQLRQPWTSPSPATPVPSVQQAEKAAAN